MEREACVCDHGLERSDLCAEIIIIIIIITLCRARSQVFVTSIIDPPIPPWEDQCEWHRMTRMTGPDCAVMCNLINTYTHTHTLISPWEDHCEWH